VPASGSSSAEGDGEKMAKDTITLALNGDITIQSFAAAISNLQTLVQELTKELGGENKVEWFIQDLQTGSATATIRGEADVLTQVEKVVDAYYEVGKALESGQRPNFKDPVVKAARGITNILDKQVTSIRFETADNDAVIYRQPSTLAPRVGITKAYSAIEGRVQTLTNRKGLRFTLFDVLHDRAVSSYLEEGQEETMREAWGKRVIIEGEVTRDTLSGRPIAMRRITSVKILPEVKRGSYLSARGIAPMKDGALLPETVIRQLRDDA
jgi:hypothetical protein